MNGYSSGQFRLITIVIVICILMSVFWQKIQDNQHNMQSAVVATVVSKFNSKIILIHAQWMMNGKPEYVLLPEVEVGNSQADIKKYKVNKYGWPDLLINDDACARIWKQITELPLKIANLPLAPVEINNSTKLQARVCRYHLSATSYIEYQSRNGKIVNKY